MRPAGLGVATAAFARGCSASARREPQCASLTISPKQGSGTILVLASYMAGTVQEG
jgi:hypothetical protein